MTRVAMTRRRFLTKAAAAAAGLAVLGLGVQCGATAISEATEVVAKETFSAEVTEAPVTWVPLTAVGEKKLVPIVPSFLQYPGYDFIDQVATHTARQASVFNDTHADIEVQIESIAPYSGAEGLGPKVMSQIGANRLDWCGMMPMFPFIDIVSRARSGMHAPMDGFIAASKEPGAETMLEDMLPFVLEDIKYQDHIYGIPWEFAAQTFTWRNDLYEAAGWRDLPETWDELYAACHDFQKVHEAEETRPYAWGAYLHSSLQPYIHSATETPYTEDGLLDFMGAGVECLEFMRSLLEAGFTPPGGGVGRLAEKFLERRLGAAPVEHGWLSFSWGDSGGVPPQTVVPSPTKVKGEGAGTLFYTRCVALFQGAAYPQELVDFLIFSFGPANTTMQENVISHLLGGPVYQSFYDEVIASDPLYSDFPWLNDGVEIAAGSLPSPRNEYWLAQAAAYEGWAPRFFEEGSDLTAEETAKNMLDEVKAEIAELE